ncbi:MAG: peptidoglycan-binding protein [Rhodobacteraceae bacterium]|nr:MAG: peptidoglycan-binding protein [Paracoccaceae bacterium]
MKFRFGCCRGLAASGSLVALISASAVMAQDQRWVQVEAHRELDMALERAEVLNQRLGNVSGFTLPSSWHALSIGPFESELDAFSVRRQLRAEGAIPVDAFVSNGSDYLEQIFPRDGAAPGPVIEAQPPQDLAALAPDPAPEAEAEAEPAPVVEAVPAPEPEETLRQAQASENALDRDARAAIQTALQWFGFYDLSIDAAFGPGTRRSMSAWQAAEGFEPTGVLTTRQRAQLLDAYRGELAALGMRNMRDDLAGISIDLPMALIEFDRHETPFARYKSRGDSGVQVLLISQSGNQSALFGLYEIMQTLEIVPLEGERTRRQNSFLLTGQNDTLRSHTVAQLRDGAIKGYTLVWTPERDAQMARVLPMMEASFEVFSGTLPDSAGQASLVSRADLLAGLAVRRPERSRSGFYIDATGTVLTSAEAVAQCERITIDESYDARVHAVDETLGLAVLKPETPLVPMAFAQFEERLANLGGEITISGFSFEDAMTRPVLTFGRVADLGGLAGETDRLRLSAEVRQGDLGGPVFGPNGAVLGLLSGAPQDGTRQLPSDVNYAISSEAIRDFLARSNVSSGTLREDVVMPPEVLTRVAGDLTVLVSCWN